MSFRNIWPEGIWSEITVICTEFILSDTKISFLLGVTEEHQKSYVPQRIDLVSHSNFTNKTLHFSIYKRIIVNMLPISLWQCSFPYNRLMFNVVVPLINIQIRTNLTNASSDIFFCQEFCTLTTNMYLLFVIAVKLTYVLILNILRQLMY